MLFKITEAYHAVGVGELKLPSVSYASDDDDGAAVCTHHPSLQKIVWHTNIMGGEN